MADVKLLVDDVARHIPLAGQLGKIGQVLLDRLSLARLLPAVFEIDLDRLDQGQPPQTWRARGDKLVQRRRLAALPSRDQAVDLLRQLLPDERSVRIDQLDVAVEHREPAPSGEAQYTRAAPARLRGGATKKPRRPAG